MGAELREWREALAKTSIVVPYSSEVLADTQRQLLETQEQLASQFREMVEQQRAIDHAHLHLEQARRS